MKNTVVIIPVSSPNEKLPSYISLFTEHGYKVILVCDGCDPDNISHTDDSCIIFRYAVKQGIGRAIKESINYILTCLPECCCAVITDESCTYDYTEVKKCAENALEQPGCLVLGARKLTKAVAPLKARFINGSMKLLLKLLCGISITDTNTSLRAFSRSLMTEIMSIQGEDSDFLINMLLYAKLKSIPIKETSICTEYSPPNKRPFIQNLVKLLNIFFVFIKFMITSLSSFAIDLIAFTLFVNIFKRFIDSSQYYILYSTILSRLLSSFLNFSLNKYTVFKKEGKALKTFLKYASLCIVQLLASSTLVFVAYESIFAGSVSESIIKIFVDAILFFVSFQVQREWVFK